MTPSRIEKAQRILADPTEFKVCEACGSIVGTDTTVCPNCNAYRFDPDPEYVSEQAILLASRAPRSVTPEDLEG